MNREASVTAGPPRNVRRSRTGSIVMLVIGALLVIGGPLLGFAAGSLSVVPLGLDFVGNTSAVDPDATVALAADEKVYLLAPVADLGRIDHADCNATAPGTEVPVEFEPASALNTLVGGTTYETFGSVTAPMAGDYTVACDTTVPVVTAPPFGLGWFFGPFLWLSVAGVAVGLVGVVLVIVGIVRVART